MITTNRPGTTVPLELTTGGCALLALILVLSVTIGMPTVGWVTGVAYDIVAFGLLATALLKSGAASLTPADRVTLARMVLVGGVTALVVQSTVQPVPTAAITALAAVALVLDAVDGHVARRTGLITPFGARFDMEVDAFLILMLSIYVAWSLGAWVLVIGIMRYVFVAASWLFPWLRKPLRPSFASKAVAAVQGVVLTAAAARVLPDAYGAAAVVIALAMLTWSFGRDIWWLWRTRRIADPCHR
ncbi:MAG TPA: CDP-alcohol phosphatidyltransferase family protein [Pseudonocardiaceae bacterium]|nr:CDP-alcohol phosphatidyltransferase family protein [Pseudonocardiaceae bacterium]